MPIMSIVLSAKTMSLRTLTEIADKQVKRGSSRSTASATSA